MREAIEDWIRLVRLSSDVGHADDIELRVETKDLYRRITRSEGSRHELWVTIAAEILWAYAAAMARAPKDDIDVSADLFGPHSQSRLGMLAKAQPPGDVRRGLERAAAMQQNIFSGATSVLATARLNPSGDGRS